MKQLLVTTLALLLATPLLTHAANMAARVNDATNILEKKQGSAKPIPTEILANAKGITG